MPSTALSTMAFKRVSLSDSAVDALCRSQAMATIMAEGLEKLLSSSGIGFSTSFQKRACPAPAIAGPQRMAGIGSNPHRSHEGALGIGVNSIGITTIDCRSRPRRYKTLVPDRAAAPSLPALRNPQADQQ